MTRVSARQTVQAAAFALPETHWKQLRDVRCPQQPGTRVDHVVVGPSGVTVIIYHRAAAVDELLPHHTAREAAELLRSVLPERYRGTVRPALCILDHSPVAESLEGVLVTSLTAIERIVRASPLQLSTSEVADAYGRIAARLEPTPSPADAGSHVVRWLTALVQPFRRRTVAQ